VEPLIGKAPASEREGGEGGAEFEAEAQLVRAQEGKEEGKILSRELV